MRVLVVLLVVVAVSAMPRSPSRIVGGQLTTIDRYPDMAALLWDRRGINQFAHTCGGTILNNRSILTAAHCTFDLNVRGWRARLGSSYVSSGGILYTFAMFILHPRYRPWSVNFDIAVIRINGEIIPSNVIQYGAIAGPEYHVADNQVVWAAGWGFISTTGPSSEQLRDVQIYTINLDICRERFSNFRDLRITDNMLCSGILDVGGRDQCFGDSGGPLYHNGVVVGVCSFGARYCADPRWPGVNTRVQRFANWLVENR